MFNYSDILLFSTELQPSNDVLELQKWWYIVPEGGQHVSFYSKVTFRKIETILNVNYYTDNNNLHILSKNILPKNPFLNPEITTIRRYNILKRITNKTNNTFNYIKPKSFINKPKTLTLIDFEFVKQKIETYGN